MKEVSFEWSEKAGQGKAVAWPVGVGGKGNEGVANYVKRIKGAIGYVSYEYSVQSGIPYVLMGNKAGNFVKPNTEAFQSACASAKWKADNGFFTVLVDQPGEDTWPIAGASFILIHRNQPDDGKAKAMLDYFKWCFEHGGRKATELNYVPIPKKVYEMVYKYWSDEVSCKGRKVW